MSDLSETQVQELFTENLKRAVSVCRQLGIATGSKNWQLVGQQLSLLRQRGEQMYKAKAISKKETERQLDAHVKRMVAAGEQLH